MLAHLQLRAAVGHAGLIAGFNANHGEYSRHDDEAKKIVDAVHEISALRTRYMETFMWSAMRRWDQP